MKLLFVCDITSIHAGKWVRFFIQRGHEATVYSTTFAPASFEGCAVHHDQPQPRERGTDFPRLASLAARFPSVERSLEEFHIARSKRRWLAEVQRLAPRVRELVRTIKPDAIHALRIPIEGFLAAEAAGDTPLAVSVWGNDLVYFAAEDERFRRRTANTLRRCGMLFSDCERDIRLARRYGLPANARTLVVPGAGGIPRAVLDEAATQLHFRRDYFSHIRPSAAVPVLLTPRGFGSHSINNVPLLKAAAVVRDEGIDFRLVLVGLLGTYRHRLLTRFAERLGLQRHVHFVHQLPYDELMRAYQSSDFYVSCTRHDGTPNSLLEAMAWGAVPVMSSLESIREWIEDGRNGFLFDPDNPSTIADALKRAMIAGDRLMAIRQENHELVRQRAEYEANMSRAESTMKEWLRG